MSGRRLVRVPAKTTKDARNGKTNILQAVYYTPRTKDANRSLYAGKISSKPRGQGRLAFRTSATVNPNLANSRLCLTTVFNGLTVPLRSDGLNAKAPVSMEEAEMMRLALAADMQVVGVVSRDTTGDNEPTAVNVGGVSKLFIDGKPMPPGTHVYAVPPPLTQDGVQTVPLYNDPDAPKDVAEHYPYLVADLDTHQDRGISFQGSRVLHLLHQVRAMTPSDTARVPNWHFMSTLNQIMNFGFRDHLAARFMSRLYYSCIGCATKFRDTKQPSAMKIKSFNSYVVSTDTMTINVMLGLDNGSTALTIGIDGSDPYHVTDELLNLDHLEVQTGVLANNADVSNLRLMAYVYTMLVHMFNCINQHFRGDNVIPPEMEYPMAVQRWFDRLIGGHTSVETLTANQYVGKVVMAGTARDPYPTVIS